MEQVNLGGAGRLIAVVVTHNRLAQLDVTLSRLLNAPSAELAGIVVVDNASTDGTDAWLAKIGDDRLHVLRSEENLGGAGGFERGMRYAVEELAPDWIVVMDDDARPDDGAFAAFHGADLAGIDALAAAVRHPDGRICDMNVPWVNPFWHGDVFWRTLLGGGRGAFHLSPAAFDGDSPVPIDGGSFVGLFLSRRAVTIAGYPDPGLFIYGDDVLYTLSLSASGGRIVFDPAVRFEHDFSTLAGAGQRFTPMWKCYYHHRNLLIVYRKAAGIFFWPALLLVVPKWVSKIRYYEGQRRNFLALIGLALRDGLTRNTNRPHSEIAARFHE